jgi:hypothetical protein
MGFEGNRMPADQDRNPTEIPEEPKNLPEVSFLPWIIGSWMLRRLFRALYAETQGIQAASLKRLRESRAILPNPTESKAWKIAKSQPA